MDNGNTLTQHREHNTNHIQTRQQSNFHSSIRQKQSDTESTFEHIPANTVQHYVADTTSEHQTEALIGKNE